jgi:cytoskeletal protein RodZ
VNDKPDLAEIQLQLESLGRRLREEREKAGLSRSDISSATRITIDQIALVEEGRIYNLPTVYARGFLKAYAKTVSLDFEEILAEFKKIVGSEGQGAGKPLSSKYRESGLMGRESLSLGTWFLIFLSIFCVMAVVWAASPDFRRFAASNLTFLSGLPGGQVTNVASVPAVPALTALPALAEDQSLPSPSPTPAASPVPVPQPGGRLILTALKGTWAQVSVDDKALEHIVFQAGQTRTFDSQRQISLTAGNGEALKMEWNGEELEPRPEGPTELLFPPKSL